MLERWEGEVVIAVKVGEVEVPMPRQLQHSRVFVTRCGFGRCGTTTHLEVRTLDLFCFCLN